MTLKGYDFYDDNGKTQATFFFKDLILDIWVEITEERFEEIKQYLKDKNENIIKIVRHY